MKEIKKKVEKAETHQEMQTGEKERGRWRIKIVACRSSAVSQVYMKHWEETLKK